MQKWYGVSGPYVKDGCNLKELKKCIPCQKRKIKIYYQCRVSSHHTKNMSYGSLHENFLMNDKNYTGGWDYWFEPQASTDWGKWGPVKLCPSNGFATGFDLKVGAMIKVRDVD